MKLHESLNHYYTSTASLSAVSRQLSFAGIAVCWFFVVKTKGGLVISDDLISVLLCFVCGLFFDLMQYIYSSAAWGIFSRKKELELDRNDNADFSAPSWINWPTNIFFWSKSLSLVVGYLLLFSFLFSYLNI